MAAMYHYATNLNACSLTDMLTEEKFAEIPIGTLKYWSSLDGWPAEREKFKARLTEKHMDKMAEAMVQARKEQIETNDKLLGVIEMNTQWAEPKSQEGMITAYTRLAQFQDELRQRVLDDVSRTDFAAASTAPVKANITPQEARVAALAIVKQRQQTIRDEMAKGAGWKPDASNVIEGKKGG